jgi:septum site-determining protein MinC
MEIKNNNYTIFTIVLKNLNTDDFQNDFIALVSKAPQMFQDSAFILDFQNIVLDMLKDRDFFEFIKAFFDNINSHLVGFVNLSDINYAQVADLDIPLLSTTKRGNNLIKKQEPYVYEKGSLRSGQEKYIKDNSIVYEGDIKSEAELKADNDIIILGTLSGKALAGFSGNDNARIFALNYQPILVSIAGIYKRYEEPDELFGHSVMITLNNKKLDIKKM